MPCGSALARRPPKSCSTAACGLSPSSWKKHRSRPIWRWSDYLPRSTGGSTRGLALAAVWVLLQPILDLVIIAAMGDEDVADRVQPGRRVKTAGGDRDQVAADALPEQARPAFAAKTALREARGLIPAQAALLIEAEIGERRVGIGADMTVEAAALPAMTIHHIAQGAGDGEADGAAFAMPSDRKLLGHGTHLIALAGATDGWGWCGQGPRPNPGPRRGAPPEDGAAGRA